MQQISQYIKRVALAMLLASIAMAAQAQDGSTAYNYLNITQSARIFSLGGVNVSTVDDDLATTDQNPSLLGSEMSGQVLLDYMHWVGGSNFAGARYAHSVGERGAWSAGVRWFGYGTIQGTDEFGNDIGSFSPSDVNFSGTFSYDITERLRGGITLKFLYSSYEQYNALAIATDLGINYFDPDSDTSFSLVVANAGGQVKRFNDKHDRLPIDVRVGISKQFGSFPVRFSLTAWNLTRWRQPYWQLPESVDSEEGFKKIDNFGKNLLRHLVFGFDILPSDMFWIGLGYNYATRSDMSTFSRSLLSGFSIGAGMNVRRFNFGIGFSQPHNAATCLMVNFNMNLQDLL